MPGPLFDDQSLLNFDTSNMNFANNYGALEFGMLGHMATNAGDTPPSDTTTTRGSVHHPYRVPLGSFSESPQNSGFPYNDAMMQDWQNGSGYGMHGQGPPAFAIETNAHFQSPENHATPPDGLKFEESPLLTSSALKHAGMDMPRQMPSNSMPPKQRQPTHISTPQLKAKSQLPVKSAKKPRDPSAIYTAVTTPHPYTANFHALIAYLQRRFANQPSKTLTIAKSLASIRPSFIATTKTLNRDDLIFMEKCFQRTLFEYDGFIEGVGTPTIVARRTGEIAAVGKEFQILTGWTKNVLLGRAPNLNVNRGHTGLTPQTGSGANTGGKITGTGWNTPTQQRQASDIDANGEKRDKPVFLAELLDDDSVVQFYEDFARLAFGDSRGSVFRKGKLLKYRTKEDEVARGLKDAGKEGDASQQAHDAQQRPDSQGQRRDGSRSTRDQLKKDGISGEKGMQKLGSADGKVDCAYCWTVKRDVFDIPMLIVMNVSIFGGSLWCCAGVLTEYSSCLAYSLPVFPVPTWDLFASLDAGRIHCRLMIPWGSVLGGEAGSTSSVIMDRDLRRGRCWSKPRGEALERLEDRMEAYLNIHQSHKRNTKFTCWAALWRLPNRWPLSISKQLHSLVILHCERGCAETIKLIGLALNLSKWLNELSSDAKILHSNPKTMAARHIDISMNARFLPIQARPPRVKGST